MARAKQHTPQGEEVRPDVEGVAQDLIDKLSPARGSAGRWAAPRRRRDGGPAPPAGHRRYGRWSGAPGEGGKPCTVGSCPPPWR
jgi:hypothetical protein